MCFERAFGREWQSSRSDSGSEVRAVTRPGSAGAQGGVKSTVNSTVAMVLAVGCVLAPADGAAAEPLASPNPGGDQLEQHRQQAADQARRVGELTNRLAEADSRLAELSSEVELKLEDANKARVGLQNDEGDASTARRAARAASAEAGAASRQRPQGRNGLDRIVAH